MLTLLAPLPSPAHHNKPTADCLGADVPSMRIVEERLRCRVNAPEPLSITHPPATAELGHHVPDSDDRGQRSGIGLGGRTVKAGHQQAPG